MIARNVMLTKIRDAYSYGHGGNPAQAVRTMLDWAPLYCHLMPAAQRPALVERLSWIVGHCTMPGLAERVRDLACA